uniref:Uncharacterized protein n=1 Tax=Arundo donax TaxID=35708 RepID=A0A0A8ZET0_ARUDO
MDLSKTFQLPCDALVVSPRRREGARWCAGKKARRWIVGMKRGPPASKRCGAAFASPDASSTGAFGHRGRGGEARRRRMRRSAVRRQAEEGGTGDAGR